MSSASTGDSHDSLAPGSHKTETDSPTNRVREMTPYDVIRYPGRPRPQTHPDRLAALAHLFGMAPRDVAHCRVLELGCGDAANLIPMAYGLPESRFVGVDLAARRSGCVCGRGRPG